MKLSALPFALAVFVLSGGINSTAQTSVRQASGHLRHQSGLHRRVVAADFNNDGIIDVAASAGTSGPSALVVRLGSADGTFAAPLRVAQGEALASGDFNNDGNLDIVARLLPAPDESVLLYGGRGDGTFTPGTLIANYFEDAIVATADFNRDGKLDVVVSAHGEPSTGVEIVLGNGDLTFSSDAAHRTFVPTGSGAHGVATGDFDRNGTTDIVVANRDDRTYSILLNQGGLLFQRIDVAAVEGTPQDVAVADMNRDGRLDVVAVESEPSRAVILVDVQRSAFTVESVHAIGAAGASRVTLGDVNRDGLTDVVTANASTLFVDDCAPGVKGMNTISVLPGRGNGDVDDGSTFALGNQANPDGSKGGMASLQLADVNRDGRLDIVASDGDMFVTTSPDANFAPVVALGPDAALATNSVRLRARVSEPDGDAVSFVWSHTPGLGLPSIATPCVANLAPGSHTFTVAVDDGHGHVATDSVTYTIPGPVRAIPLAPGWSSRDLGAVGAPGRVRFDAATGTFAVTGSGADVWGTADALHFARVAITGDFEFTARVASIENLHRWVKAGLMARESASASSRHGFVVATPRVDRGVTFQRRAVNAGPTVSTAGSIAYAPPVWLKLERRGDTLSAYYRKVTTDGWTAIGTQRYAALAPALDVGLGVSSHIEGTLATARFDHVSLRPLPK